MGKSKLEKLKKRKKRVRGKLFGTKTKPRLSVYRSNNHIYAQLINDEKGETVIAVSDIVKSKKSSVKNSGKKNSKKIKSGSALIDLSKVELARETGKKLAALAVKRKIKMVQFDRGGYKYHGRVKALADGAREGGLKF